jgi:hypothetical protein
MQARADESAPTSDGGTLVATLNGTWQIVQDTKNEGEAAGWFKGDTFPSAQAKPIQVPGVPTEVFPTTAWWMDNPDNAYWYFRTFPVQGAPQPNMRDYLRFGAVMADQRGVAERHATSAATAGERIHSSSR